MKPKSSGNLLCLLSATGLILLAVVACGSPTATEPAEGGSVIAPTPTSDTFESPLSAPATLAPLIPEAGMAGAYGVLVSSPADWAGKPLFCWFAAFYQSQESEGGFFLLEPSQHPSVELEPNGSFRLGTIPPGEYVIVLGPSPEVAIAIQDARGPRVFNLEADTALDLGEVRLEP